MTTETTDNTTDTNNGTDVSATLNELQTEVEKWKKLARKHEQRAATNAEAAEQLARLQQSESETVAERIERLEKANAEAQANALRFQIASEHKISKTDADLFLTGTDEETITAQAKRLAEHQASQRKTGAVVEGEGTQTTVAGSDLRQATQKLFKRDT